MRVNHLIILVSLVFSMSTFAEEETPSIDLLEFLGDWETQGGQWIDPTQFVEIPELTQIESQEKVNE